ncbi:MAG: 5,10-methylenetetrahydrofolate reductase [Firmicutes bacterium]|jgi:ferredoxin|nr:5,10-methylenetetrahydrofolate reductase [Bacillota bacterium]
MKSLTRQKPFDEVKRLSVQLDRVFLVGCGTCATMARTGGIEEVRAMEKRLQDEGKLITGTVVIPTACDEMTAALLEEHKKAVEDAQCIIVLACALGVQRVNSYLPQPVIPALDTLFIGMEKSPGYFFEACDQCGQCILGETAGICPLTACHKGLLNGPCGGTNKGKCEVDPEKDCAFTLIYERLKEQGRLDLMRKYHPPRNHQVMPRPRETRIS